MTNYRREYRMFERFGKWAHAYEVVGRWGAVSLNITEFEAYDTKEPMYSAGLEFHYDRPDESEPNRVWDYHDCPVAKGRCWHEGTSLYAQEHYLPMHLSGVPASVILDALVLEARKAFPRNNPEIEER